MLLRPLVLIRLRTVPVRYVFDPIALGRGVEYEALLPLFADKERFSEFNLTFDRYAFGAIRGSNILLISQLLLLLLLVLHLTTTVTRLDLVLVDQW